MSEIEKIVVKKKMTKNDEQSENLKFWLSKSPQERIEAVEILRRQYAECSERLQRVVRIIKLKKG